jgi:hypothetical protein
LLQQFSQTVAGKIDRAPSDAVAAAARDKWEMAWRTRRLASALSLNRDRETLISYAEELEREAEAVERQAAAPVACQAKARFAGSK